MSEDEAMDGGSEDAAPAEDLRVIEGGQGGGPNAVLKSLTMTGFKSFVHETHMEFAPGITAVIGPNGSGKSNVADAIRWALGENNARVLRAKKNEELIFAGSETRRGLGMAEAVLQLDNSSRRLPIDFEEIEVGRRLYKSGEAEYLVNRARVRLRDLQDLLAGAHLAENPFVVIGQGLVDQVLALRPSDRRTVIEEAAGTRRLHLRREDALERLKKAELEMVRVVDILREIGPRVALLTEQVAKWNEYENVRNELRRRALRWYRSSFGETATARAELLAKLTGVDREIERLADYVNENESLAVGTDDELRVAREEEERRRLAAAETASAEASLRERVAGLQASLEAIAAERDRARTVLSTLPAELSSLRQRRASADQDAAEAAGRARAAADAARAAEEEASTTRVALAEARAKRVEMERGQLLRENDQVRLRDEDAALLVRDEELSVLAARLTEERAEQERERERIERELQRARAGAEDAARSTEAASQRVGATRAELQGLDGELALLRGQQAALREALERGQAELAGREQSGDAVTLRPGLTWLHDRIAIPPHLRALIDVALGATVALSESDTASVDHDQMVTVLVANTVADAPVPDGCRRFTDLADLAALDPAIRRVASAALGNVFIETTAGAAIRAARTMSGGTVVNAQGVVAVPGAVRFPGTSNAERDALARLRATLARLGDEVTSVERTLAEATARRDDAERRMGEAEQQLAHAHRERDERGRVADELAGGEADMRDVVRAAQARGSAIERERSDLLGRRERIAPERDAAQAARAQAANAFNDAESGERVAAETHALATKRAEDARLEAATSDEKRSSHALLRDALDEQVAATERRIAEEEERVRTLGAQERDTQSRLTAAQEDLGRTTADAREAARSADLARERALAAEGSRRESEQRLAKARERLAELRGERGKLAVEEERASGAMRMLEEQVRQELGLPDDEPLPDPESLDVAEIEDETERTNALRHLQRLRRRLIALEPVNPLAATELAEVGERHGFLAAQRADLDKAMSDLRSLADELATAIAEQFSATFQAVDREFGVFFQRLFNGGQASLRTSDAGAGTPGERSDDEPGIDIYARPPGKRIGSLQQLSGGERALTATALLLAILRVKPAPFCVLDEVDAALDERNVGRFTQALRELTDRTQFVVITHNRATIEAADTLYGVSMDEGGTSKVISLRLADLDERAG